MTTTWADADAGSIFVFQSAGNEMAVVCPPYTGAAAAQLQGFSLAAGDTLDLGPILRAANLSVTAAELGNFFSTTESNGSTLPPFLTGVGRLRTSVVQRGGNGRDAGQRRPRGRGA